MDLTGKVYPGGALAAELTIDPNDLLAELDRLEALDVFGVAQPRFALPSDT